MKGDCEKIDNVPCLMAVALNTVACTTRSLDALASGEVRVRVECSMVSTGTELHHIQQTHTRESSFPRPTGYIAAGRVVGLGPDVKGFEIGERVTCGGGHLAALNAHFSKLKRVPEGVDPVDACAVTLLGISLRGIRAGQVRFGDSVAVFGLGVIGQYAAHLAKLSGAFPVIGIDPVAKRRDIAKQMGADIVIDPFASDAKAEVFKATGNEGVRVSIDASATAKVIATLPDFTAEFGRLIVLGGVHGLVPFDLYTRFQKSNLTMVGCGSPFPTDYPFNESRNEESLLQMIAAKMVRPRPVVTHYVSWQKAPEMYRMLIEEKDKALGVAFDWSQS
jgi:2-desacetyl-2-hydroxyethyl bacteriochlorophyllide A dehydrogenase